MYLSMLMQQRVSLGQAGNAQMRCHLIRALLGPEHCSGPNTSKPPSPAAPPLALLWSAAIYLAELLHKVGTFLSYSCRELARNRSTTHNKCSNNPPSPPPLPRAQVQMPTLC
jgi:hypothetical protein